MAAPRADATFRGSSTYASASALADNDQGRRDDLWSWFYIVLELIAGKGGAGGWVWPGVERGIQWVPTSRNHDCCWQGTDE